ncbi:MAG TPA: HAD-IA family hydrolase [Ktedonobacterales bacterium]|nr:HAD-IA family hydrolase [Ktedonobacterales bacterium]
MIAAMLFDVDGVLIVGELFSVTLAREYGITTEMTATFFRGPFERCLIGKADLKAEIASHLPQWGWRGTVEEFLRFWFTTGQQVDEALLATAQQLRQEGVRCYLATNQERYRTDYLLTQTRLAQQFDGCFASSQLGYTKDDPRFFQTVLRALPGVQASDVLFWDDSPANVQTARAAGLHAEVYTTFANFQQQMRFYTQS